MKYIILDTETTGVDEEDRIIQLSYLVTDLEGNILEMHDDLCTAPLPTKFDSMAIHNITPEMLEGKPVCVDTKAFARLHELNIPENIMVIQNAEFDEAMLAKEGFTSQMQLIDTYRILRKKYPLQTPHGLQHKRYELGLYKKEPELIKELGVEVRAHDALGDVVVLKLFLDHLLTEQDMNEMMELCSAPIMLDIMTFGKHKGKTFEEIALNDRNSLQYMIDTFDLDTDLRHTMETIMAETKSQIKITIPFAKYRGETPEEVAAKDPGFLKWIRDKADRISPELKEAVTKPLSDIGQ
ncbi:MAG: exonuclease domain-containing protein [Sulfurimonadaceae bacterium]